MDNKASPPSTNPTKKCRDLFPYFPNLESRLAGEHDDSDNVSTRCLKNNIVHTTNKKAITKGGVFRKHQKSSLARFDHCCVRNALLEMVNDALKL
jgi:hypothetical protein